VWFNEAISIWCRRQGEHSNVQVIAKRFILSYVPIAGRFRLTDDFAVIVHGRDLGRMSMKIESHARHRYASCLGLIMLHEVSVFMTWT
jgi:hypothetical protein